MAAVQVNVRLVEFALEIVRVLPLGHEGGVVVVGGGGGGGGGGGRDQLTCMVARGVMDASSDHTPRSCPWYKTCVEYGPSGMRPRRTVPWLSVVKVLLVAFAKVNVSDTPEMGLDDLSTTFTEARYALTPTTTVAEPEVRFKIFGASNAPW